MRRATSIATACVRTEHNASLLNPKKMPLQAEFLENAFSPFLSAGIRTLRVVVSCWVYIAKLYSLCQNDVGGVNS